MTSRHSSAMRWTHARAERPAARPATLERLLEGILGAIFGSRTIAEQMTSDARILVYESWYRRSKSPRYQARSRTGWLES